MGLSTADHNLRICRAIFFKILSLGLLRSLWVSAIPQTGSLPKYFSSNNNGDGDGRKSKREGEGREIKQGETETERRERIRK